MIGTYVYNSILDTSSNYSHTALGRPRGMVWGGRREKGSGWGHMYTCGGFILIFGKTNTIM